ncbi:xanthine dehydrogenase family protein subunit M, partial [Mesorhizobium sp. M7A.F.Ca.CA.004.10.1.1]
MALALQTFATVKDANAALKAQGTRYLGGGTLVVRAANEGDVSVSG